MSIEAMPEHLTARGELVEPHERVDWGRAAPATLTGEDTLGIESTSGGMVQSCTGEALRLYGGPAEQNDYARQTSTPRDFLDNGHTAKKQASRTSMKKLDEVRAHLRAGEYRFHSPCLQARCGAKHKRAGNQSSRSRGRCYCGVPRMRSTALPGLLLAFHRNGDVRSIFTFQKRTRLWSGLCTLYEPSSSVWEDYAWRR